MRLPVFPATIKRKSRIFCENVNKTRLRGGVPKIDPILRAPRVGFNCFIKLCPWSVVYFINKECPRPGVGQMPPPSPAPCMSWRSSWEMRGPLIVAHYLEALGLEHEKNQNIPLFLYSTVPKRWPPLPPHKRRSRLLRWLILCAFVALVLVLRYCITCNHTSYSGYQDDIMIQYSSKGRWTRTRNVQSSWTWFKIVNSRFKKETERDGLTNYFSNVECCSRILDEILKFLNMENSPHMTGW